MNIKFIINDKKNIIIISPNIFKLNKYESDFCFVVIEDILLFCEYTIRKKQKYKT